MMQDILDDGRAAGIVSMPIIILVPEATYHKIVLPHPADDPLKRINENASSKRTDSMKPKK
jgi:hypothetical protein